MYVYGELKNADLHNLGADPAPGVIGRLYWNTVTAKMMVDDGISILQVLRGNLTGDVTSVGMATSLTNAAVTGQILTGFVSGAGALSAADSILHAFQKIDGNLALKAPLQNPALVGPDIGDATGTSLDLTGVLRAGSFVALSNIHSPTFVLDAGASLISLNPPASGSYNFNLPLTAGTAGQVLTSQGGGSNAMTWESPGTLTNPVLLGQVGILAAPVTGSQFSVNGTATSANGAQRGVDILFTGTSAATSSLTAVKTKLTVAASTTTSLLFNNNSTAPSLGTSAVATTFIDYYASGAFSHIATNNASFSNGASFSGNYFIYQGTGTDPSVLTSTLTATDHIWSGTKTANFVLAGPTSGSAAAPAFRALVSADFPARATGSSVGAGGVAISSSSGFATTTSNSYATITNQSVTLVTNGRPVRISLQSGSTSSSSGGAIGLANIGTPGVVLAQFILRRDGTVIAHWYYNIVPVNANEWDFPINFAFIDILATAASHVYDFQYLVNNSNYLLVNNSVTVAYEL